LGVRIVQELWANEISCELAVDASSFEELVTHYKDDNHIWVVIVKQDSKERGLKVKSLIRKEEFDIRCPELVGWLRAEIRARTQREGGSDYPKLLRNPSQQDTGGSGNDRANDVRILVSQLKSKKTNRRNIIESGKCIPHVNYELMSNIASCSPLP
jgi:translation initiation factor 2-alpha kinase 4